MNMRHTNARVVFIAALALLAACGGERRTSSDGAKASAASGGRPLTIKGSDTMVILGQRLAEEYMKKTPGSVVQVNGGGSGTGIAALINGSVDLAQSSRPMKDDERQKAEAQKKATIVETPIALDALGVFVHASNPVQQLTIEQTAAIFTGKTKNWKEVGGKDAPIIRYGRESSSGTYDYFREHVLNKADFAPNVQTLQGTAAIINAIGQDPNGIGYGGIAYAKDVRPLKIGTSAAGPFVEPTLSTVENQTYPISRKLFFYYADNAPDRVKQFVEWSLTPEAQALVGGVGYFPLTVGTTATDSAATHAGATDAAGTAATSTTR